MTLRNLSEEQQIILTEARKREKFGELSSRGILSHRLATDLQTYLTKIDTFLTQQIQEGWKLVSLDAVGRDSLVMESATSPDLVRKWYRSLSYEQITCYYTIMADFGRWLKHFAPVFQLKFGWLQEQFLFDPKKSEVVLPKSEALSFADLAGFCLYGVDLPKISGEMLRDQKVSNQLDYLFACFIDELYGGEKVQKIFFPFKKINTPLKIFQYPNLRKMEDETIVLLDVNRIQHVVRTLYT